MAPKPSMALLFHPKKGTRKEKSEFVSPQKPQKSANPRPRPKPIPTEPDEEELKLPDGPFQEFRLMSSALNGWKYDVMKFDSRKSIDISRWQAPIKLNRKELRRDNDEVVDAGPTPVAPMLGPDGKPVIGMDGKMVMVDAEGKPIHNTDGALGSSSKGKGQQANGKKRFQKKTRQVFFVPEEVRQLRREERYPWVMEDSSPNHDELWVGQMEDASKAETFAFFMPAANDVFKFVPAHRWYKFQKKLKHDLPTDTANVESLYTQSQKRDPQAWLATRNGKGPSAATAAMFKAEAEGRSLGGGLVHSSGQSLGPGGRKLKVVDSGVNGLLDDDEDGENKKRRVKELNGEGDMDEQVYEEDFADDDEQMEADDNDEEAKELEERLKREYKTANKQRETGIDESDEEETPGMTKQAKAMQKLIRNREGNDAYESEEEENPYASSASPRYAIVEEEEEEPVVTTEPAIQPQLQQVESRASSQPPKPATKSGTNSRATSPVPTAPTLGGHSVVAKRATSPKGMKLKPSGMSSSTTPLGSRAASPVAISRAGSPAATNALGSPGGSANGAKLNNKRKATDDIANGFTSPVNGGQNAQAPKTKKRKAQPPGVTPTSLPAEQVKVMLIEWLASTANATTKDCIKYFTPYLTDADKKREFSDVVREVAILKDGVLILRKKFQEGGSSAPSPAPLAV